MSAPGVFPSAVWHCTPCLCIREAPPEPFTTSPTSLQTTCTTSDVAVESCLKFTPRSASTSATSATTCTVISQQRPRSRPTAIRGVKTTRSSVCRRALRASRWPIAPNANVCVCGLWHTMPTTARAPAISAPGIRATPWRPRPTSSSSTPGETLRPSSTARLRILSSCRRIMLRSFIVVTRTPDMTRSFLCSLRSKHSSSARLQSLRLWSLAASDTVPDTRTH
ncbi:hypothetical protein BOTBODRAFT_65681 [Botryobasidium botryosum FD-172 SS1]|uniref:Uncharacterized protein n=1 Tax=Botryobasidium botryosum (strain FD-172 SS1) TaxID=930990 RepID=A0A067MJV3_BOTB1|nr:hypothetical protein BOTBODRAFT_65681 [Botryobasidium botryosum FD-172 SS1]